MASGWNRSCNSPLSDWSSGNPVKNFVHFAFTISGLLCLMASSPFLCIPIKSVPLPVGSPVSLDSSTAFFRRVSSLANSLF